MGKALRYAICAAFSLAASSGCATVPDGYTWSLPLLYSVFAIVVALLYLPCAWFAQVKARHPRTLLRYL